MDSTKHLEIEIKFTLKNPDATLGFLQQHGEFVKESFQKDTYFLPPNKNYLEAKPIHEWLRLRESDKGDSINYKNRAVKDGVDQCYCDEFETHLDSIEDMKKIFGVLDIKPLVVVNKKRKVFMYQGVEIAIDEVDDL
ncbi:MAG: class IV adenylate cyclase [bacterium]